MLVLTLPTELTPTERTVRARLAAHKMHAAHDSRDVTAAARAAFLKRFEHEVDPEGILPEHERARRAEHARKAYFVGLALKSAQARRKAHDATNAGPSTGRRSPNTDTGASPPDVRCRA
ncbi:MAG: hypothetical protein ACRDZ1_16770 [Acidimicrobiia bacterium]